MSGSLGARTFNGVLHTYAGNVGKIGLQFIVGVCLARILGPEAFGAVAVAWIIVGIGSLLADVGISSSIVQKDSIQDHEIAWAFYAQTIAGLVLTLAGWMASPFLAVVLGNVSAEPMLCAMSLTFLVRALGQTSGALLSRRLQFGVIQSIALGSYLFSYGLVGLGSALAGLGAWSVIAAHLTQITLTSILQVISARPPLMPSSWRPPIGLMPFGVKAAVAGLLSWIVYNIDSVIVSRICGAVDLGLYNRSMTTVNIPVVAVSGLQSVLFSAGSRMQRDDDAAVILFLSCTAAVGIVVVPALWVAALLSETVIVGLFGNAWRPASAILTPLAIGVSLNAYSLLTGPLLMSRNKTVLEIGCLTFIATLMVAILPSFAKVSVERVAWAMVAVYAARSGLTIFLVLRILGLEVARFARSLLAPIILMTPIPMFFGWLVNALNVHWPPEVALAATVGVCSVGFAVSGFLALPYLLEGPVCRKLVGSGKLPPYIARRLSRSHRDAPVLKAVC